MTRSQFKLATGLSILLIGAWAQAGETPSRTLSEGLNVPTQDLRTTSPTPERSTRMLSDPRRESPTLSRGGAKF